MRKEDKETMRAVYFALIIGMLFAAAAAVAQQNNATVQAGPSIRAGYGPSADVFVNGLFAIRIPASAGGMSPMQRAQIVADRLNQAFNAGLSWESLRVSQFEGIWGVGIDSQLIATADANSARAYRTTPGQLASRWARQTVIAMGGNPQMIASQLQPIPSMVAGARAEITPTWTTANTKTVPLLDSESGNEIGSVMVAGTTSQLNKVNSVIAYHSTSEGAEVWTFVPVTSTSVTSPTRVQGVGLTSIPSNLIPMTGWQMGNDVMQMINQSGTKWNAYVSSNLIQNKLELQGNTKIVPVYSMDSNQIIGAAQVVGSLQGIGETSSVVASPSGSMWKLVATSAQVPPTGTPTGLTDVVVSSLIMVETTAPEMTTPPSPPEPGETPPMPESDETTPPSP